LEHSLIFILAFCWPSCIEVVLYYQRVALAFPIAELMPVVIAQQFWQFGVVDWAKTHADASLARLPFCLLARPNHWRCYT
jgi:hypothetical protein